MTGKGGKIVADIRNIDSKLEEKKKRREAYLQREMVMLSDGVQSYGVGSRSATRYNTDLAIVRKAIEELEKEIEELEGIKAGKKPRRAFGVVIRDW